MIDVRAGETPEGWMCTVVVSDGDSQTRHRVTVHRRDYERLAADHTPEMLVRTAFQFLLERESKEAILPEFDLTVIAHYFPEFNSEMRRRLGS